MASNTGVTCSWLYVYVTCSILPVTTLPSPLKIAPLHWGMSVYPWRDNAVAEDLQVPGTIPSEGRCLLVQLVAEACLLDPGVLGHPMLPSLLGGTSTPSLESTSNQGSWCTTPSEAECGPCVFAIPHYYCSEPPRTKQALSVDQYSRRPILSPWPVKLRANTQSPG